MSIIGTTINWREDQPVALPTAEDRRRHVYVIGQTGTGKTILLRNLILQDIHEGRGVGFIDPHGGVAEELLDCIPPHRTDDVAYFNPADLEYPVGLNPLQKTHRDVHHLVVDSTIATFKSIWGTLSTPHPHLGGPASGLLGAAPYEIAPSEQSRAAPSRPAEQWRWNRSLI
jgi:Helicase HerA, central domain